MTDETGREELLRALQKKLCYSFEDRVLLEEALTHSSYANENAVKFNERLEFLGDAVLELVASNRLYHACPDCDEGQMTRLRAQIVCKNSLSKWAAETGLKPLIRIGKSLVKSGPTDSVAADCVEALFGAVFIDGGFHAAAKTVSAFLDTKAEISGADVIKDPKTVLQEYYQRRGMGVPHYHLAERTGPEHASNFKIQLIRSGKIMAEAWGATRQEAEFKAAEMTLKEMTQPDR